MTNIDTKESGKMMEHYEQELIKADMGGNPTRVWLDAMIDMKESPEELASLCAAVELNSKPYLEDGLIAAISARLAMIPQSYLVKLTEKLIAKGQTYPAGSIAVLVRKKLHLKVENDFEQDEIIRTISNLQHGDQSTKAKVSELLLYKPNPQKEASQKEDLERISALKSMNTSIGTWLSRQSFERLNALAALESNKNILKLAAIPDLEENRKLLLTYIQSEGNQKVQAGQKIRSLLYEKNGADAVDAFIKQMEFSSFYRTEEGLKRFIENHQHYLLTSRTGSDVLLRIYEKKLLPMEAIGRVIRSLNPAVKMPMVQALRGRVSHYPDQQTLGLFDPR